MFTYLKVKNFALIDDVEIDFKQGFTAFVGETGAGKSLLVDAINLLSGARSSASFVKKDCEYAFIQGSFYIQPDHKIFNQIAEYEIFIEAGEELIAQRQIMADGRTSCKIQGVKVPATFLKQVMHTLVDIHGQHENNTLLDNKNHLKLLDSFGQDTLPFAAYQKAYTSYQVALHEQEKLALLYNEVETIPLYEKQIAELQSADVKVEEVQTIDERLQELKTFNRNFDTILEINQYFSQTSLVENLYQIKMKYEMITDDEQELQRMNNAYYDLQDIQNELAHQADSFIEQKQEQEKLEARIAEIFTLQKKYGDNLTKALEDLQEKVNLLQNIEFEYLQSQKKVDTLYEQLVQIANELRKMRKQIADILEKEIMQQLSDLYMNQVEFKVVFQEKAMAKDGFDQVEFYIKTNIGTEFQPLMKIASGGELSRIMLAIKIVFTKNQDLSTIIFDEIDTGVSGSVAEAIAKKLQIFSLSQQVFAITHLPQVLAASNHQLLIEKMVIDDTTHIKMRYLTQEEHQLEVAKMLSGTVVSDISKQHAQNLIQSFVK